MRMRGLEPPRPYGHTDLNRARLPIPPHPRAVDSSRRGRFGHAARKPPSLARRHSLHDPPSRTPLSPRASRPSRSCEARRRHPRRARRSARSSSRSHSPPLAGRNDTAAHRAAVDREQDPLRLRVCTQRSPRRRSAGATASCSTALPSSFPSGPSRGSRGSRASTTVDAGVSYTVATVTAADVKRADAPLAGRPSESRRRHEDRHHRRRRRPAAPVLLAGGYTMPAGFPKGQTGYTTAKVIVARAFAPASTTWRNARLPFDPEQSEHGTHVAGIAAGNAGTVANGTPISGVAPRAYIGNYKALSVPTDADVGLDGNAAGARGRDRGRGRRRHGRDQPLPRRARGRAHTRSRRARARRRRARRRHPRRCGGKRLRRVRQGIALLARARRRSRSPSPQ